MGDPFAGGDGNGTGPRRLVYVNTFTFGALVNAGALAVTIVTLLGAVVGGTRYFDGLEGRMQRQEAATAALTEALGKVEHSMVELRDELRDLTVARALLPPSRDPLAPINQAPLPPAAAR